MKAVVILLLGIMLVCSCLAMPRKVLTDEKQAHDKAEAMQGPVTSANVVENAEDRCMTGPSCTHHRTSLGNYPPGADAGVGN